jgi:hypothetical protein
MFFSFVIIPAKAPQRSLNRNSLPARKSESRLPVQHTNRNERRAKSMSARSSPEVRSPRPNTPLDVKRSAKKRSPLYVLPLLPNFKLMLRPLPHYFDFFLQPECFQILAHGVSTCVRRASV